MAGPAKGLRDGLLPGRAGGASGGHDRPMAAPRPGRCGPRRSPPRSRLGRSRIVRRPGPVRLDAAASRQRVAGLDDPRVVGADAPVAARAGRAVDPPSDRFALLARLRPAVFRGGLRRGGGRARGSCVHHGRSYRRSGLHRVDQGPLLAGLPAVWVGSRSSATTITTTIWSRSPRDVRRRVTRSSTATWRRSTFTAAAWRSAARAPHGGRRSPPTRFPRPTSRCS